MSDRLVYIISGGSVVHLSSVCAYVAQAGSFERKTVRDVRRQLGGEPKVCASCRKKATKKTKGRA